MFRGFLILYISTLEAFRWFVISTNYLNRFIYECFANKL